MKIWYQGKFENIEIGQKVLVARCSSGHSVFGEYGTFKGTTKKNAVFETESGSIVKTAIDNLHQVAGKAKKAGYFVSLNISERKDLYKERVGFWNSKKMCFEYK